MSDWRSAALADGRARLAALLGADPDAVDLLARYDRWAPDLLDGLAAVYHAEVVLPSVVDVVAEVHLARSASLRDRDRARILRPDWYQAPDALGYVAYADLLAGDLDGVRSRIGYLADLGVTRLRVMGTPRKFVGIAGFGLEVVEQVAG